MSDMKCPFCNQELECMGKYTDGSSKWLCNRCGLFGDKILFDEIIRTRKALDVAVDALNKIINAQGQCWGATDTEIKFDCKHYANEALDEITELEQKDKR